MNIERTYLSFLVIFFVLEYMYRMLCNDGMNRKIWRLQEKMGLNATFTKKNQSF